MNTFNKYWWCRQHPKLTNSCGGVTIEITPHMVDPLTSEVSNSVRDNTCLEWWIKLSFEEGYRGDSGELLYESYHEPRLDCRGATIDNAIERLYELVKEYYGEYNE